MSDRWAPPREETRPTTRTATVANLVLRDVLMHSTVLGVDAYTLRNLIALKDALVDDFLRGNGGEDRPTQEFTADLHRQLVDLAANHSRELKARECEAARRKKYGATHGFVPVEIQVEEAAA